MSTSSPHDFTYAGPIIHRKISNKISKSSFTKLCSHGTDFQVQQSNYERSFTGDLLSEPSSYRIPIHDREKTETSSEHLGLLAFPELSSFGKRLQPTEGMEELSKASEELDFFCTFELVFTSYPNTWAAVHSTGHLPDMFFESLLLGDAGGGKKMLPCCHSGNQCRVGSHAMECLDHRSL